MRKTALVTGITGQDGRYLSALLLERGVRVVGLLSKRRGGAAQVAGLHPDVELEQANLLDFAAIARAVKTVRPDEVYNLAAETSVRESWNHPVAMTDLNALTVTRLLEAIRLFRPQARFFQASSAQILSDTRSPQNESTPFGPRNLYGVAKLLAHQTTTCYRRGYRLFACSGILFNHESPLRDTAFVTRKITRAAARIKLGLESTLPLGNLEAARDWGFAGDFVKAMWAMLQADQPRDYVIGTGKARTVREFAEAAFSRLELDWRRHVVVDPELVVAEGPSKLEADPTRARLELGWEPATSFPELVEMMVEADLERARRELAAGGRSPEPPTGGAS